MSEEASADEQPITFHIKTAGDQKFTVTVPLSKTVLSLKELLSSDSYAKVPPERQRLIYSGRVLKDADTLASYKIKENNTVHMVKSAESNARQQPANQGAAASSAAPAPQMATGTGANNLLAGLTGARYAGLAQLPNQSMFGPDGGMGPPPDPEEQLRMLENPAMRQQMSEMLNNPAVLDEMIRQNPMLANIPNARQMLQSPMFRQMMTDPQVIRQQMQMMRAMGQGQGPQSSFAAPGGVDGAEGGNQNQEQNQQGGAQGAAAANPFGAMFGQGAAGGMGANPFAALMNPGMFGQQGGAGEGQTGDASRGNTGSPGAQNPLGSPFGGNPMMQNTMNRLMQNPELMQQMMQTMFGPDPSQPAGGNQTEGTSAAQQAGGQNAPVNPFAGLFGQGAGAGGAGGVNPFGNFDAFQGAFGVPPAGPPDNRPPEERYAEQLRQLNEMGFHDFDQNVAALRRSGGNVQGAINHLFGE